jgi:serine-type D-Ala-D-Ala carboxypeptidase (penicillin-binding protein 5/6)
MTHNKHTLLDHWLRSPLLPVLTLIAGLVAGPVFAQQSQIVPRAPDINASSYIVMDAATGAVVVEENADQALPPASLTKIMTVFVADNELAAGNISLDDEVHVSVKAWRAEGSKMFIQEGTVVRLEDILRGIIIQSGNDASPSRWPSILPAARMPSPT